MRLTFYIFFCFLISMVQVSCTADEPDNMVVNDDTQDEEDEQGNEPDEDEEPTLDIVITEYWYDFIFDYDHPSQLDIRKLNTATIENNKLIKIEFQEFEGDVGGDIRVVKRFEYENDLLTFYDISSGRLTWDFTYDANDRIIAATQWDEPAFYYFRFVHQSETLIYHEKLTLPHDDPQTEIIERIVLTFDENDNVLSAGFDNDLDGEAENKNICTYENNSLTSVQFYNGEELNYSYSSSPKRDTEVFLYDNSIGKKVNRIISAPRFASIYIDTYQHTIHSEYIPSEVSNQYSYTIVSSAAPFYWSRWRNRPMGGGQEGTNRERIQFGFEGVD